MFALCIDIYTTTNSIRYSLYKQTKTYEDWSKYVGNKPYNMGVVARMYTNNTLSFLTDGLRNVFYNKEDKGNRYQPIDSLAFSWQIETNYIKHIEFAELPTELGNNGSEITMVFTENYYQKYDIFEIDGSKQQCLCVSRPVRKADKHLLSAIKLINY